METLEIHGVMPLPSLPPPLPSQRPALRPPPLPPPRSVAATDLKKVCLLASLTANVMFAVISALLALSLHASEHRCAAFSNDSAAYRAAVIAHMNVLATENESLMAQLRAAAPKQLAAIAAPQETERIALKRPAAQPPAQQRAHSALSAAGTGRASRPTVMRPLLLSQERSVSSPALHRAPQRVSTPVTRAQIAHAHQPPLRGNATAQEVVPNDFSPADFADLGDNINLLESAPPPEVRTYPATALPLIKKGLDQFVTGFIDGLSATRPIAP